MVFTRFGIIVSWFPARSYGFIRFDSPVVGMPDKIFLHGSDVPNQELSRGLHVSFEIGKFGGKYKAINVKPAPLASIDPSAVQS
jgi:cold shock CspA family protein